MGKLSSRRVAGNPPPANSGQKKITGFFAQQPAKNSTSQENTNIEKEQHLKRSEKVSSSSTSTARNDGGAKVDPLKDSFTNVSARKVSVPEHSHVTNSPGRKESSLKVETLGLMSPGSDEVDFLFATPIKPDNVQKKGPVMRETAKRKLEQSGDSADSKRVRRIVDSHVNSEDISNLKPSKSSQSDGATARTPSLGGIEVGNNTKGENRASATDSRTLPVTMTNSTEAVAAKDAKNSQSSCQKSLDKEANGSLLDDLFDDDFEQFTDNDFFDDDMTTEAKPLPEVVAGEQPLAASFGRHRVIEVDSSINNQLILVLETIFPPILRRKMIVRGTWAFSTPVFPGDIVHLEDVEWDDDVATIDDRAGSLVVNPDVLVSGTAVVSGLFCMRKAVLAERLKGGGGGNKVMLLGTLVHEIFQEVLSRQEYSENKIVQVIQETLQRPTVISELTYLGISEKEIRADIAPFIHHIIFFVRKFMHGQSVAQPEVSTEDKPKRGQERPQWKGRIERVMDIEENIWSPRIGIKGKIDLTVQVQGSQKVIPLELKTGRPTFSSEHTGQVMLYSMMTADRRPDPKSGLLLYLRSSNVVEVPAGRNETRGLIQLRNQLVAFLSQQATVQDGTLTDVELPDPISHERACSKCDYLDVCAAYQKIQEKVPPAPHPMANLVTETLSHLTSKEIDWFKHWSDMLTVEASESRSSVSLAPLWCSLPSSREGKGSCISDLKLMEPAKDRFHKFQRKDSKSEHIPPIFSIGDVVILSSNKELALSQGTVARSDGKEIVLNLDRDVSSLPGWREKTFYLDRHQYQGSMSSNFVAIAKLLSSDPQATALRHIIVNKKPPTFLQGLAREVAVVAKGIIKHLNTVQKKAIFRSMMAESYCMIRGMPGTGKSTTIVGLIRLLAALNQSVLLVSYTNSAVDTVLLKLKEYENKFIRLGRRSRVHKDLLAFTADEATKHCKNCDELTAFYNSYKIVATTCLATDHAAIVHRKFDWCVVDEASQALLPSLIHPLLNAAKFILVGDPAQLPPVVQSKHARDMGLSTSLFDWLDSPAATLDLNIQYRMNSTIANLANYLTYKGKLECGTKDVEERCLQIKREEIPQWTEKLGADKPSCDWLNVVLSGQLQHSVLFLDTSQAAAREQRMAGQSGTGGYLNRAESDLAMSIVGWLTVCGLQVDNDVGIMAPYTAQVKALQIAADEKGFGNVEIGTVDQFQGRDKEVVIYSCTRSFMKSDEEDLKVSAGHILNDERRLNVALTRARSKLILIGDLVTLEREYEPFRKMAKFFTSDTRLKVNDKVLQMMLSFLQQQPTSV